MQIPKQNCNWGVRPLLVKFYLLLWSLGISSIDFLNYTRIQICPKFRCYEPESLSNDSQWDFIGIRDIQSSLEANHTGSSSKTVINDMYVSKYSWTFQRIIGPNNTARTKSLFHDFCEDLYPEIEIYQTFCEILRL